MMSGWGTTAELQFVAGLGRHATATGRLSRAELLQRYITAGTQRTDWGSMDVAEIARVAKLALRHAEERAA